LICNVAKHMSLLHAIYVVFPVELHYVDCLIKEFGIDNSLGNRTYAPMNLTKEKILDNHRPVFF
jgi:hypothetical protein